MKECEFKSTRSNILTNCKLNICNAEEKHGKLRRTGALLSRREDFRRTEELGVVVSLDLELLSTKRGAAFCHDSIHQVRGVAGTKTQRHCEKHHEATCQRLCDGKEEDSGKLGKEGDDGK